MFLNQNCYQITEELIKSLYGDVLLMQYKSFEVLFHNQSCYQITEDDINSLYADLLLT